MSKEFYHILNRGIVNLDAEDFCESYQEGDICYVSTAGCALLEELSATEISEMYEFYNHNEE